MADRDVSGVDSQHPTAPTDLPSPQVQTVVEGHPNSGEQDDAEDILQQAFQEAATNSTFDHQITDADPDLNAVIGHENESIATTGIEESEPYPEADTQPNGSSIDVTVKPSSSINASPLGSKSNPIRIIQQGNTYTSMQHLSPAQVQQIVSVLQQQNINTKSSGSTAVFNPETKTRIVYRVVQPGGASTPSKPGSIREYHHAKYGRPAKRKRRASDEDDEDDSAWTSDEEGGSYHGESDSDVDGPPVPNLTTEEKEAKKREKPKTRSGRVSKPPTHMAKDYNTIHRVSWYEDYDDSDGGYSDFYASGDESRTEPNRQTSDDRRRKWKCGQCDKAYIGYLGLARHYRNTKHGDCEALVAKEAQRSDNVPSKLPGATSGETSDPTSGDVLRETASVETGSPIVVASETSLRRKGKRGPGRPRKNPDADDNWTPPPHVRSMLGEPKRPPGRPPGPGRSVGAVVSSGRESGRPGRPPLDHAEKLRRWRSRVSELIEGHSMEDILDVVCPKLASNEVSLWSLLERGLATPLSGSTPTYTRALQLYTDLQGKMAELAQACLTPIPEGQPISDCKPAIQISYESIAASIGVETGTFEVSDLPSAPAHTFAESPAPESNHDPTTDEPSLQDTTPLESLDTASLGQPDTQPVLSQTPDSQPTQPAADSQPTQPPLPDDPQKSIDPPSRSVTVSVNPTPSYKQSSTSLLSPAASQPISTGSSRDIVYEPTHGISAESMVPDSLPLQPTLLEAEPDEGSDFSAESQLLHSITQLSPGDIINVNGENIIIPEGANIVQTSAGIVIYQPAEALKSTSSTSLLKTSQPAQLP